MGDLRDAAVRYIKWHDFDNAAALMAEVEKAEKMMEEKANDERKENELPVI